jgi:hypothetical protein
MNEYLCVQVLSNAGETDQDFLTRLEDFWDLAHYLLAEGVYARHTKLEDAENRRAQHYLVYSDQALQLEQALDRSGFDVLPVETSIFYAEYEATPPEWEIVEHPTHRPPAQPTNE